MACAAAASVSSRGFPVRIGKAAAGLACYNNGRNDGPPDLDELWRDFNRKLSGMFGGKSWRHRRPRQTGGNDFARHEAALASAWASLAAWWLLGWLGSGFFIVQEGQQGVVTSFGKYSKTVEAGFQWRFPYPFQAARVGLGHAVCSQVEVGRNLRWCRHRPA